MPENVRFTSPVLSASGPLAPGALRRAVRTALVVGTVLTLINQGDVLAQLALTPGVAVRIALNFVVPLAVSLYAMLGTVPELRAGDRSATDEYYRCRNCPDRPDTISLALGERLPSCPTCGPSARWIPSSGPIVRSRRSPRGATWRGGTSPPPPSA